MALQFTKTVDNPKSNSNFYPKSLDAAFGLDGNDYFYSLARSKIFKDGYYWTLPSVESGGAGDDKYTIQYSDSVVIADAGSGTDYLRIYRRLDDAEWSAKVDGRHLAVRFGSPYNTATSDLLIVDAFRPDGSIEKTEFENSVILDTSWSNLSSLIESVGIPFENLSWDQAIAKGYLNLSVVGVSNDSAGAAELIDEIYAANSNVTLAVSQASVAEDGASNIIYTFARTGSAANALTVNYSIGGTADSSDYSGATPGTGKTIIFAAGASTATLTIDPMADTNVESDKTVALSLASGSGYTIGTSTAVTATITNDDHSITLDISPVSVLEDGATNLIYTFSRTGPATNALIVNYSIGGTAYSTDYSGATQGTGKTITFAAGTSTATLTIDPTADSTVEAEETIDLTLSTGTGYTIGTAAAVVGRITNDDFPAAQIPAAQIVESVGFNMLKKRLSSGLYVAQRTETGAQEAPISKDGSQIYAGIYGSDWQVLAAEQVNGVNQLLWKNSAVNRLHVWSLDSSWNWQSSAGWDEPTSTIGQELEADFGIDLDGNGTVASPEQIIETTGSISLIASGSNRTYSAKSIAAGAAAVAIMKDGVAIYKGIYGADWTVLAAETVAVVNQLLWKHTSANRLHVWSLDSNWNWTASSGWDDPSSAEGQQLEVSFQKDLNGDGVIAAPTTAVETAGTTQLMQGTGKRYSVQGTTPGAAAVAIKKDGAQIYAGIYGADWQVLAAESVGGVNQVLWKNTSANRLHVWNLDANWTWTSSDGWDEATSSRGIELETQFGIDLNGDGKVAQPSSSVEEQGSVWLIKGSGNTYSARSTAAGAATVAIQKDGVQIAQGIYGNDWQVLAAETVNGTNQVLWQNTPANRLHVWSLDSNWAWKSSAGWDEPLSAVGQQLEADFGIDLDGNGTVGTPTTRIETAGLTSLLKGSGNKYSIQATAAGSNPVAVIKDGVQVYAGIYGNDWQVLAAETVNGTNQVLWKNTLANRLHVWSLDSNWNWKSSAGWDEPNSTIGQQLEAAFGIDLDGNGTVATSTATNTTIEAAGSISLLKGASNKYSAQSSLPGSVAQAIKNNGDQIYEGIYGSEWKILAAKTVNGSNQVLWNNTSVNRLHVWTLDGNWNRTASSGLIDPLSGVGKELEAQFGIDTNVDGIIRIYNSGSSAVDLITGGTGDEFFSPLGVSASGVDRIITGGGSNQIQLQASNGGNFYASNGEADLLVIEGFDASKDQLLVVANKPYGTTQLTLLAGTGVGFYEDRNGDRIYNSNSDELLVLLEGTNSLPSGAIVLG